ncbi:hypothetical protein PYH37_004465 [Sinorhizobium numidicum]|uniref:Uncharacterized protein n=1 Tax=Sinorhizobium numidicum TaxID=680248 RepID=A0ABY8CY94_9HYPH|nr:hypothetical protein [Sinorhizobium numidicum]WEX76183.1 hypothetical protein PYH37_004465 [Sinorhizobium numidicum]WEX82842.1 hypothetical protein PYH38_005177 [Sinorhizobium numidicum]
MRDAEEKAVPAHAAEIARLTERLAPVGAERVAECLEALKRGGMAAPAGIAPADFLREYMLALSNVPPCGLTAAIVKLKRGEYAGVRPGVKPGLMPVPAELAALARLEARSASEDLVRERAKASTLLAMTRAPVSPEAKARVLALLARFRRQTDAARADVAAAKPSPKHAVPLTESVVSDGPAAERIAVRGRTAAPGEDGDKAGRRQGEQANDADREPRRNAHDDDRG